MGGRCDDSVKAHTSIATQCQLRDCDLPGAIYTVSVIQPMPKSWAIFRNVFPVNFCLHCGPCMTEINAEKNGGQSAKRSPASFVRFPQPFYPFPRWFRPYADRSRDGRSRETILKIAQSGHRLSLRLSMGDGRSGWWAPGLTRGISHYFSCSRYQLFTVSNILISNLTVRTLDHEDDATFFPLAKCKGVS